MGILRVDHPDIMQFIDCKRDGSVTNFNISVAITDEFMRALEADGEYDVVDPSTKEVVQHLRARDVMDAIVAAAWATGDPGLVFIDRANRSTANPTPDIEPLEATNPCVVGETRLATSRGLLRMDALCTSGEELVVTTDSRALEHTALAAADGSTMTASQVGVISLPAVPVFKSGEGVSVRKLITSHGIEITATPYHRFLTTEGYKRLDELEYGDSLLLQSGEGNWSNEWALPDITYGEQSTSRLHARIARGSIEPPTQWSTELGELLGYIIGDGYVRRTGSCDVVGVALDEKDEAIASLLRERIARWFGVSGNVTKRQGHLQVLYSGSVATFLMGLGIEAIRAHKKRVPDSIFSAPRDAVIGFLRGLFSADGSVQIGPLEKGTCSVRLATSSKGLAQDVQQLLLNLGIVSAIRLRRQAQVRLMPNAQRVPAEYHIQAQYEVLIDKANRDRFAEVIGFMQSYKQAGLTCWIANKKRVSNYESFTTKVALIEDAGTADVYDTTVPEVHSIIVNGLATAQCGEQWLGPLRCLQPRLINLGIFVHDGEIDWTEMERVTRLTTRFLDDVIEINPFPLPEVHAKVHANRRIGLGVMGWAEMLFELGLPYDSEAATALGEHVMTQIRDWATDESRKMAEERGEFPNFSRSIYKDGPKVRNATCTTVAPTGSISILADCSSGIEPIFALAFQHRVKQPDGSYRVLDFVNPFFKRALESSDVEDKAGVLEYVKTHGSLHGHPAASNPALKPYVTAHEIAPDWHIRMQASFQKGVQNSISKTINVPNSATYDDVRDAYMLAWNLGCLGITVFRDGSKSEQVLNVGVKEQQPAAVASPPVSAEASSSSTGEASMDSVSDASSAAVELEAPFTPAPAIQVKSRYPNGVKPRAEVMSGYTRQVRAPEGTVNITLNSDHDGLFEVFVNVGKAGSDVSALAEALGRLISRFLQIDSPLTQDQRAAEVARQLSAIGGSTSIGFGPNRVRSLPDAVARALDLYLGSRGGAGGASPLATESVGEEETSSPASGAASYSGNTSANGIAGNGQINGHGFSPATHALYTITGNLCPQCGNNTLYMEEGCKKCVSCGHSEC